jgi:mannose-6-phosphate isomerase-like protein (cupin superfamily)
MDAFHHRKLPGYSTLLSGSVPPDTVGFRSELLQIWYNHTAEAWRDAAPHMHQESDECFIVLQGSILVEVEGVRTMIGSREFCCFARGTYHAVVEVYPPVETLMIRAPSKADKHYQGNPGIG